MMKKVLAVLLTVLMALSITGALAACAEDESVTHTVTFLVYGGSEIDPITVEDGKTVARPDDPVKAGYDFVQWNYNFEKFDFSTPITADIELDAVWQLSPDTPYAVTVYVENADGVYEDKTAGYSSILGTLTGTTDSAVDLTDKANAIAAELGTGYYFDKAHDGSAYTGTIAADGSSAFALYFTRAEAPADENVLISYTGELTSSGWVGEGTNSTFTTEVLWEFTGVPDVVEVEENTASILKIGVTNGNNRIMFEYVPENQDWSAYDYIGFWVYNGTDKMLFARHGMHRDHVDEPDGSTGVNGSPAGNVERGCWNFVTVDMGAFKVGGMKEVYEANAVEKFSFEFERNNNEWGEIADGSTLYITDVRGYNYDAAQDDDENLVVRMDGVVGPNNLAYWTESAAPVWTSKYEEVTVSGTAYRMTKVEYHKETATTGNKPDAENAVLFGGRLNTEEMADRYSAYTFKVYNPNTFDVVIAETTIPAGQIKEITISIVVGTSNDSADGSKNWFTSYRMMINPKTTDGKPIAAEGVSLYLGNVYGIPLPDSYTVSFDSDGGTDVADMDVARGEGFTAPTAPTKTGYTFAGWYLGDVQYNFEIPVTGDLTLKAKWTPNTDTKYTVEVYLENAEQDGVYEKSTEHSKTLTGTTGASIDLNAAGGFIATLQIEGWHYDSAVKENVVTGVIAADGSLVLKVYYSKDDPVMYTVTFMNGEEQFGTPVSVSANSTVAQPSSEPEKQGYIFDGWYTDAACGQADKFDFKTPITENTVLYAGWKPAENTAYSVRVFAWDGSAYPEVTEDDRLTDILAELTAATEEEIDFAAQEGEYKTLADQIAAALGALYELNKEKGTLKGTVAADGSTQFELYFSAKEGMENLLVAVDTSVERHAGTNNTGFETEEIAVSSIDETAKAGFDTLGLSDTDVLKLTITSAHNMIVFNTVPQLQNWSGYDYIGFWVYNGSASEMYARTRRMAVSTYVGTSVRMHPGEWTFVMFDLHKYPVGAWDQVYDLDGVKEYAIEFEKNGNSSAIAVDSVFYFSSIRGYKYVNGASEENVVERMDEVVGVGAIADATERIAGGGYAFDVSLEKVNTGDGERSMTKVEYLLNVKDAAVNDNFRRNLIFPGVLNTDTRYSAYRFDVYNANDYEITILGQKIAAKTTQQITVQCVKTEQSGDNASAGWGSYYRMRWYPHDGNDVTPKGLTIYIGNIYGVPKT